MKRLVGLLLSILIFTGIVYAKEYEVKKSADGYDVTVKIDRNPPSVGKNNVTISITKDGSPITDAEVIVNYSMPPMPGMPPMDYKTKAALKGKEYTAVMDLSMSGPWNVGIKIKRGGKTTTVKFNLDVR